MCAGRKFTVAGSHLYPTLESFLRAKEGRLLSILASAVFVMSRKNVSSICVQLSTTTPRYHRSFHGALGGEG